jgi:hypothetical protein
VEAACRMDPYTPWQGSQAAAPGKAVEGEHDAASRKGRRDTAG